MYIKKQKLSEIIFTRVLATIGIIIFHYFSHSNCHDSFFYITANVNFGSLWITCFFAISGAVLFYNYPQNFSLKTFYFRRWKAIFPIFWLSWLFWYIIKIIYSKHIFWGGNPLKLILSFLGIDGYFYYIIPNYYLVGEWFLGAIIFLYILYPLLCRCINKNIFIVPIILLIGYIWKNNTNFFVIMDLHNLITCIASFYFGMIAIKYKKLFFENKIIGVTALILFLFLDFMRIKILSIDQIQGFIFFIILIQSGRYIMKTPVCSFFSMLDKISFPIFLFHHQIINVVFKFYNPSDIKYVIPTLIFIIFLTILFATIFSNIINFIFKTPIFKKIESLFI